MSMAKCYRLGIELLYIRIHTCHRLLMWRDCCSLKIDLCSMKRKNKRRRKRQKKKKKTRINKSMLLVAHTYTLFLLLLRLMLITEMRRIETHSLRFFPISWFPCQWLVIAIIQLLRLSNLLSWFLMYDLQYYFRFFDSNKYIYIYIYIYACIFMYMIWRAPFVFTWIDDTKQMATLAKKKQALVYIYIFDQYWKGSFRNGRENDDDCSCVSISIYLASYWLYQQYT